MEHGDRDWDWGTEAMPQNPHSYLGGATKGHLLEGVARNGRGREKGGNQRQETREKEVSEAARS